MSCGCTQQMNGLGTAALLLTPETQSLAKFILATQTPAQKATSAANDTIYLIAAFGIVAVGAIGYFGIYKRM